MMDANASNYNADATAQGYDQYGNLQCVYASCDDIQSTDVFTQTASEHSTNSLMLLLVHLMVEYLVKSKLL